MGKTSLFSRVALSPGAGNDKKGVPRGAPESSNDNDTMASTQNAATMNQ